MAAANSANGKPHILLTGSSGFIGQALYLHLLQQGYQVTTLSRHPEKMGSEPSDPIFTHFYWDLRQPPEADWFKEVDCVIHLAAATSAAGYDWPTLTQLNVDATAQLYQQASAAACNRFIFLSSAQVNWADKAPYNNDLYTQSKLLAEQQLQQLSHNNSTGLVIIRPALVYGPGVKGNFAKLLGSIERGSWLPLGAVTTNRRSMLALANLISFIQLCLQHPLATQQSWDLADVKPVSTAALIQAIGQSLRQQPKMLTVPVWFLRILGSLTGKRALVERLLDSAVVSTDAVYQHLHWQPPITLQQQLDEMQQSRVKSDECAENQPS